MRLLIDEIVQKLQALPEGKIFEVLDFIESLTPQQPPANALRPGEDEFEILADRLADAFQTCIGSSDRPVLSDYAVSRAGIYQEHP